jgi:hypothetical protein
LVIPAISELRETWTSVFGFKPLEGSSKQKMRNMKMVAFPGIDMLQKPLLKHHQFAEANMVSTEGIYCVKSLIDDKTCNFFCFLADNFLTHLHAGSMELKEHHTMDETSSNSDEKCSPVRFDLKVSTETSAPHTGKINDQAAAVESGYMADCLNDTSDITSENATLSTCPKEKTGGRLSVVPDNLKGRDKNTLKTPDYMGNANEQTREVAEGKRKVKGDAHMNQSGVSEVESKLSGISFMGSEAADFQGQCQLASKEDTENVPCEVKVEDSSDRQNRNSVHTSSEIITSQPRHLVSELELEVSGTNAAHHESTTCNISGDVAQSTTTPLPQKVQDDGNDHCGVLPGNQNISSCQVKEPISKEMVVLATADPNSDVTAKRDLQSCRSNGFCFATELGVSSCGVDVDRVHDLKEVSDTVQSDAISPYGGSISDGPRMNIKSSEHANSVSEVEPASLTGGISEPLCNSSSARLHCASGGGNSCGAPEVIILSNQAS